MFTLCDSFFFLLVLLYFIKYPLILSTLSVPFAGASKTLPLVINSTSQWLLFANKINANDSNFNSNKFFLLANDLDFANNSINPVGSSSSGFKGTLYGNKHSIKSFNFSSVYTANKTGTVRIGLFDRLVGAKIYDLTVKNPTITITNSTNTNSAPYIGGLAVQCDSNTLLCNVSTTITANRNDTTTTATTGSDMWGGLVAYATGGKFYKCQTYATFSSQHKVRGSGEAYIGGVAGSTGTGTLILQSCAIRVSITVGGHSALVGGVLGVSTGTLTNQFSNLAINCNLYKKDLAGNTMSDINTGTYDSSCDWGSIIGWNGDVVYTDATKSFYKNIYITGNHAGQLCGTTGGPYCNFALKSSNIYCNGAAPSKTQWGAALNDCKNYTNSGSDSAVAAKANADTNISNYFTISSTGVPTSKLNAVGNIGLHRARQSALFYRSLLQTCLYINQVLFYLFFCG